MKTTNHHRAAWFAVTATLLVCAGLPSAAATEPNKQGDTPAKAASPAKQAAPPTPAQEFAALEKEQAALLKDRKKGIRVSLKDALEKRDWYKSQLQGKVHPETKKQIEESIADYEKVIKRENRLIEIGKRMEKLRKMHSKPGEAIVLDDLQLAELETDEVAEEEVQGRIELEFKRLEAIGNIRTPSGMQVWADAAKQHEEAAEIHDKRAAGLSAAAEEEDEWAERARRSSQQVRETRSAVAEYDESGASDRSLRSDLEWYENRTKDAQGQADKLRSDVVIARREAAISRAIAKAIHGQIEAEEARQEAFAKQGAASR